MICVDQALCAGCGICVDGCPIAAITLVNDIAQVDADLCDGCGVCVQGCPNYALTWVAEPLVVSVAEPASEHVSQPSSLVVVEPPVHFIAHGTKESLPWRRAIVPAVGGTLTWIGREIVPRLAARAAPLALNLLNGALDRRISRWSRDQDVTSTPTGGRQGRGGRRRRRRGRS